LNSNSGVLSFEEYLKHLKGDRKR